MTSANDIRNKVIDQLLAIKILAMSEEDIKAGRTIDQATLNERELEWLKRK